MKSNPSLDTCPRGVISGTILGKSKAPSLGRERTLTEYTIHGVGAPLRTMPTTFCNSTYNPKRTIRAPRSFGAYPPHSTLDVFPVAPLLYNYRFLKLMIIGP